MSNKFKGIVFGAVAAATYGMNPLFALPLYKQGMSVDSVLFYRYALAALLLLAAMKFRRQQFGLKANEAIALILAGLLFAASSLCLFVSYRYMDAGIASTMLFVYPVMVAVIMAAFFREKISPVTAVSIVLALSGIALLYKGGGGSISSLGILLVMFSALSYAIYIVGVNKSALCGMTGSKLTFYSLVFGISVYIVRLDFFRELQVVPSWFAWGNILAIAVLPTVVSLICTALAIRYVGPTPTAILGALEPVTAVFFGVSVFGEQLTFRVVAGIAMIIVAVSLIVAGKPSAEKLNSGLLRLMHKLRGRSPDRDETGAAGRG